MFPNRRRANISLAVNADAMQTRIYILVFPSLALSMCIGAASAVWCPIYGVPPNGVQITCAVSAFLSLYFVWRTIHGVQIIPSYIGYFLIRYVVYILTALVHATIIEVNFSSIKMFVYMASAITILNFNTRIVDGFGGIALFSSTVFLAILYHSASKANVDIVNSLTALFMTLNSGEILYGILRPMFDAFTIGADIVYSGSVMNEFAYGSLLLSVISLCDYLERGRVTSLCIFLGWFVLFIIVYSGSAAVAMVFMLPVAIWNIATKRTSVPIWILRIFAAVIATFGIFAGGSFLSAIVQSDFATISTGLKVYLVAIDTFFENPILGSTIPTYSGMLARNFALSLSISTGILGLILALISHPYILIDLIRSIHMSIKNRNAAPSFMVSATSIAIFLAFTLFGGGNWIPTSIAGVALGVGYSFYRRGFLKSGEDMSPSAILMSFSEKPSFKFGSKWSK